MTSLIEIQCAGKIPNRTCTNESYFKYRLVFRIHSMQFIVM